MGEGDARAMALGVVRGALDAQVELMVALQYLGMLVPDALAPLRVDDAGMIDRILSVPPAPDPVYPAGQRVPIVARHAPRDRVRPSPDEFDFPGQRYAPRHRVGGSQRTLFAQWMENEIPWSPAVMGWADDDVRAEGFEE